MTENTSYFVVQSWMVNQLKLTGNELMIFAVIYGFSQDGESSFYGSLSHIASLIGTTSRTVINGLNSLISKGFIEKETMNIKGAKSINYRICKTFTGGESFSLDRKTFPKNSEDFSLPSESFSLGGENFSKKSENFSHNNKDNKYIYNSLYKEREGKNNVQNFHPPTLAEIQAYCTERNNGINPQAFLDFYQSKGWMIGKSKMKDWKAAVRTWEQREISSTSKPVSTEDYDSSQEGWDEL